MCGRADMDLYFDSSVYDFIYKAGEARAVRRWIQQAHHQVRASDEADLGEALRTPDPVTRAALIRTITTVAPSPTYPSDLVCAEEFLGEVRRCRPAWIKTYPSLKSKEQYLRWRRGAMWAVLKTDPSLLPARAAGDFKVLKRVIRGNIAAQKASQQAERKGLRRVYTVHVPELVSTFATYSELEKHARVQAEADWRLQLMKPTTPSAENDWLLPHLDGEAMSHANDWSMFWFKEADLGAMPTVHLATLVEYFQRQRPITPGNTLDRIHAQYLVAYDRVVTADADLYDALVLVTQQLKVRGSPVFIKRPAGGSAWPN
jgi:hypothetical protein